MSVQLDAMRQYMTMRQPGREAAARPDHPSLLIVGGGKGGVGTSVIAALVALSAAATGRRVLLVDADEHVGPQRFLLGTPPSPSIADLRRGVNVASLAVPVSATLSLVPGGPGQDGGPPIDPAERRALLRRVAALYPGHDSIVIDGGSRLDTVCACRDASATMNARLLVVAGTDPIALAASYALLKAVRERAAVQVGTTTSLDVLVNRADAAAADHAFAQLAEACRAFLGVTSDASDAVGFAGALPDDTCLDAALRAGMPLQDAAAGSPAAVAAQALTERLLDPSSARPAARKTARPANPYGSTLSTAIPAGALR